MGEALLRDNGLPGTPTPRGARLVRDYPSDWPRIADAIRERDGNACVRCGATHGEWGWREEGRWVPLVGMTPAEAEEAGLGVVRAVICVCHLDQDTTNNDPGNLRCLCRGCHGEYDSHYRERAALIAAGQLEFPL